MAKAPKDIEDLNKRIEALKEKNKKDSVKSVQTDFSKISIGIQLGIELASGPIVGAAIGYMLDELFDTKFILLLTLTIFGGFAGILNAYMYIKSLDSRDKRKGK